MDSKGGWVAVIHIRLKHSGFLLWEFYTDIFTMCK